MGDEVFFSTREWHRWLRLVRSQTSPSPGQAGVQQNCFSIEDVQWSQKKNSRSKGNNNLRYQLIKIPGSVSEAKEQDHSKPASSCMVSRGPRSLDASPGLLPPPAPGPRLYVCMLTAFTGREKLIK